ASRAWWPKWRLTTWSGCGCLKHEMWIPRGAELYRRQVVLGLSGDQNAASKARVFLRKWFGGKIRLDPLPDGGLMAYWNQNVAALVDGLGICGSGGLLRPGMPAQLDVLIRAI